MFDYTRNLPPNDAFCLGPNDLFVELYPGRKTEGAAEKFPPLLFVHGAFTGSWMWAKYVPHFIQQGFDAFYLNLRGHYRSRAVDLSRIVFKDYLDDIRLVIDLICESHGVAPVLVGFSMGGLLSMKIAEDTQVAGLVLIDSSICSEVHNKVPYVSPAPEIPELVVPAPLRAEFTSIDESPSDIAFQRKFLSMESANVYRNLACPYGETGISVNGRKVCCPSLVLSAVNNLDDDLRGQATASHINGDHIGIPHTTHTGLLVGQKYNETVAHILAWLCANNKL